MPHPWVAGRRPLLRFRAFEHLGKLPLNHLRVSVDHVEQFRITASTTSEREYQGHQERTLEGAYETVEVTLPAGTAVVRLDQPLGRLAFYLLEPRSDDGLAAWNFFDRALQENEETYPIVRAMNGSF